MQNDTFRSTLADVALRAGVSKATASKALAGRYDVRQATRERVIEAARELNFTPNFFARSLNGAKTQTIGFITSDFEARFVPEIMAGTENALGAERSFVIMCNTRGDHRLEELHVEDLMRRSVDGLIVASRYPEPRPPLTVDIPVPVVYVYGYSASPEDTSVVADNVEGGSLAVRHLIAGGSTRIACIAGPLAEDAARDRAAGAQEALRQAGLSLVTPQPLHGAWSERWGWEATAQLMDEGVAFDGLFCGDDQIARGALDLLQARGVRVPQDVSVIGYDNWRVISERSRFPFTSVDMNLEMIGQKAAKLLTAPDGPPSGIHRVTPSVVARKSTRTARLDIR